MPISQPGQPNTQGVPLALVAVMLLAHISYTGSRFAVTLHALSLHANSFQIGMLLSSNMVGPLLLSVSIGRWTDRLGYAPVVACGLAMMVTGAVAAAAFPVLPMLYVASVLAGTGFMALYVAINNAVAKVTLPENLTRAFAAVAMAASLAGFVAPLIAGAAIQTLGFAAPYLVLSLCCLAGAWLLRLCMRRHPVPGVPTAAGARPSSMELLTDVRMRPVFVAGALFSMAWDLFVFFAPLQGVRAGLGPTATGAIVSAMSVGMFTVRMAAPRLTMRFGEWPLMAGSMLICALAFFIFPLLGSFAPLVLAGFLVGISLGGAQPVAMALLCQAAPRDRIGEAAGVRSTISSLSQTVLPAVLGGLGSAVGVVAVFWVGAVLMGMGAWSSTRRAKGQN